MIISTSLKIDTRKLWLKENYIDFKQNSLIMILASFLYVMNITEEDKKFFIMI